MSIAPEFMSSVSMMIHNGSPISISVDEELRNEIGKYSDIKEDAVWSQLPMNYTTDEFDEFGVFKIKILQEVDTCYPASITIAADISSSMDDTCMDGRRKIQHAKHSLTNIVHFLHEKKANIILSLFTFNTNVQMVFSKITIATQTEEQVAELIKKIEGIRVFHSTDISLALQQGTTLMSTIEPEYGPKYFFMLSDGEPNRGELDFQKMERFLHSGAKNYYFGYGTESAAKMQVLANTTIDSKFIFIPHVEEAFMAFAEALDEAIHASVTQASIHIQNGEIYDPLHNNWCESYYIGNLVKDKERTFLFRTRDQKALISVEQKEPVCILLVENCTVETFQKDEVEKEELQNYCLAYELLRLQVIQQLHKVYLCISTNQNRATENLKQHLILTSLFIQTFMRQHDLLEDENYITLYNDISIAMQTFYSSYAELYSSARLYAQVYESRYKSVTQVPAMSVYDAEQYLFPISPQGIERPQSRHMKRRPALNRYSLFDSPPLPPAPLPLMREGSLRRDTSSSQRAISECMSQGLEEPEGPLCLKLPTTMTSYSNDFPSCPPPISWPLS
jgi:von Willebrand factor type A domain